MTERDTEEDEISQRILKILIETKEKILFEGFSDFDAAYFDVDINLRVKVDDKIVQIKEGWRGINTQ